MGDRGNIVVRGQYGDVWLYSHYHGSELKDVLKRALARRQRWDDEAYLARIVFSEMLREGSNGSLTILDGEGGFGISTFMCDNEHGILVVDVPNQKVCRMEESGLIGTPKRLPTQLDYRVSRTFEEYAANGFKKRIECRYAVNKWRRTQQPAAYGLYDRRKNTGSRKDD
jgi:hypothetical protein